MHTKEEGIIFGDPFFLLYLQYFCLYDNTGCRWSLPHIADTTCIIAKSVKSHQKKQPRLVIVDIIYDIIILAILRLTLLTV
jgi:hypothetical protein